MQRSGHNDGKIDGPAPKADWVATPDFLSTTNLHWLQQQLGVGSYEEVHAWSVQHREEYWATVIKRLRIVLTEPYRTVLEVSEELDQPRWLPGARMNIVESCFGADPDAAAIIQQEEGGQMEAMSYAELKALASLVAGSLRNMGRRPGDAVAVIMPMTAQAVAIYLGIIAAGCVVVGVPESFSSIEISKRLRIARTVTVFAQDFLVRAGKRLPIYEKISESSAPSTILIHSAGEERLAIRAGDQLWQDFLRPCTELGVVARDPDNALSILFSSGTTGEPKAIPWLHTTPIKCAADAHFHLNVKEGGVLVWPTSLGWMMGPWLIFAALMNRATLGLYHGTPSSHAFGEFVQDAKVTMLGVVPSLVRNWRASECMTGLQWDAIEVFGSTGECSNADDMRWLMKQAGGRPVIEYRGGTEIGGAYLTGTLHRPHVAGLFNTLALGLDGMVLDGAGAPASVGEFFIVPPSIGLSTSLINHDHHSVYFEGTPSHPDSTRLRRHGDQIEQLPGGYWRAHGRVDDTMNLGGIKVSAVEIEKAIQTVPGIVESAAIGVSAEGGPCELVIFAVRALEVTPALAAGELLAAMQSAIRDQLNPLFKIARLELVASLPRTASNKVLRRELRDRILSSS